MIPIPNFQQGDELTIIYISFICTGTPSDLHLIFNDSVLDCFSQCFSAIQVCILKFKDYLFIVGTIS